MSTCYGNQSSGFFTIFKIFFILLFCLIVWIAIGSKANLDKTHGDLRHGADAQIVRENCDNNNVVCQCLNLDTKNTAVCVELKNPKDEQGRKYGIQIIDEEGNEITAFIKDTLKWFNELKNYLRATGYRP